jgi:hypothetical protein
MEEKTHKCKTPAFREQARARARAQWTPEARESHSALIREKMLSPIVRENIRVGMQERRAQQLRNLVLAWRRASQSVRERFVAKFMISRQGEGS